MRILILLVSIFWSGFCFAQTEPDQIDFSTLQGKKLSKALKTLNRKYDFKFSYNPDALEGIIVPDFGEQVFQIEIFLSRSLEETGFSFEKISETYVIVPEASTAETLNKVVQRDFVISGIVRDRLTGESLPFAGIGIKGSNASTTSNIEGKFTIMGMPTDTSSIVLRYLGYRDMEVRLNPALARGKLILEMDRQERNLPSVQITAVRQNILEVTPTVSQYIFNPTEISKLPNLGENDLFAALRWLPGVGNGSDATTGLRIRGGASDQNLVMFDGITVYHVDHFFGFLSAFNTNVVKHVLLNKGGFDARYGGRTAGLLDITGIDGNKKDAQLTVEANFLSANLLLELPIVENRASLVFAYRRAYTTIIQSPAYRNIFNNIFNSSIPNVKSNNVDIFSGDDQPEFFYYDMNAKFNFNPTTKDAISVSYYEGQDDLSIAFRGEADGIRRVSSDITRWGNRGGSVKWSRKWNDRFFSYLNYGISRYRSNLDSELSFFFADDELFSRRFFNQRSAVNDNSLRLDNSLEIAAGSKLEFGVWLTNYKIELQAQDQEFIFQDSLQEASLRAGYLQLDQKFGKLTLKPGLRVSAYESINGAYFEPRFSAGYQLRENLLLKGAVGRYYQMIRRLNERSLYFSIPETWALASESTVPVLRSDQFILGATLNWKGWVIDVEAYHKSETGMVEFLFPEFGISSGRLDQFAIDGHKRIFGADFLLKKSYDNQNIMMAYTLLRAESKYDDINFGNYFPSIGESTHEWSLLYNYEWKRWDFSGGFVLSSGQPYTPVLGTYVVTLGSGEQQQFVSLGGINSERLEWFHRLDVSSSYTMPLKKGVLQMGVSVYNVYNNLAVKYVDYFQIPEEDSDFYTLGRRDILSLGLTPSLFLKLKL